MLKKFIGIIILISTIALIVLLVKGKKRPDFSQPSKSTELKLITEIIRPIKENVIISANGNVSAKWQTEMKSEVSGAITFISDKLLTGATFSKGDVLMKIDPIEYQSQLSRQQANLAQAKERLLEEKIRAERALNDWKSLKSNKPANDYTLRKPQLNTAEMNYLASQNDVKVAQKNLSKTIIKAPYDGYVVSRLVDLGETIQVGSLVAEVFSSEDLELILPLKTSQVEMILSSKNTTINVHDITRPEQSWLARFARVEQSIDKQSRWRNMYLSIAAKDNPNKNLPIQGAFLQADIKLDLNTEFLKVDEKSINLKGEIWLVDENNLLKRIKPRQAFRNNGFLFLYPDINLQYPISIVSTPSSTLLEGMQVSQQQLQNELIDAK